MTTALLRWVSGFAILGLLWSFGCCLFSHYVLPTPVQVYTAFAESPFIFLSGVGVTCVESLGGLVIACLVTAITVALIMAVPNLEDALYPLVTLLKATPVIAFVPLAIVVAGTGIASKAAVAAIIAFFPLFIGALDGMKAVPDEYTDLADIYCANPFKRHSKTSIGWITVGYFTGLKSAAPMSVVGAMVSEYVVGGTPQGLGSLFMSFNVTNKMPEVFAASALATFLGFSLFICAHLGWKLLWKHYKLEK